MKIKDFEKKVRDRDGITVVIRARRTANISNLPGIKGEPYNGYIRIYKK